MADETVGEELIVEWFVCLLFSLFTFHPSTSSGHRFLLFTALSTRGISPFSEATAAYLRQKSTGYYEKNACIALF